MTKFLNNFIIYAFAFIFSAGIFAMFAPKLKEKGIKIDRKAIIGISFVISLAVIILVNS